MSALCVKLFSLISQPLINGFGFDMGHLEALTHFNTEVTPVGPPYYPSTAVKLFPG